MNKYTGKLFTVMIVVTIALSFGKMPEGMAQSLYYSTSTSLMYSTELFTQTVAATKTDSQGYEWLSIQVRSTNIEERDRFVVSLEVQNVYTQQLFDIQIAVGFRFPDATWSKPYLGSIGDFEAGQLKKMDLIIITDLNLYGLRQPDESDIKQWKIYYVVARTRQPAIATRTQTQLFTFTYTVSAPPTEYVSPVSTIAVVVAAFIVAIIVVAVLSKKRARAKAIQRIEERIKKLEAPSKKTDSKES